MTSKSQIFFSRVPKNPEGERSGERGDFCNIHPVAKYQQNERGTLQRLLKDFGKKIEKGNFEKSDSVENCKRGQFVFFQRSFC